MSRQMHLGSLAHGVGAHVAGWRMPGATRDKERFENILEAVQIAERGRFDFVFFADAVNTGADAAPTFIVRFEPLTLLGALAARTSTIGLVATVSTSYSEPYNVARAFASLDHLSEGRIGWNVVTTSTPDAAANFGKSAHIDHDTRYEMAEEFVGVTKGLWDSWEDGAHIADVETGVFMDASRLHPLNHSGRFYNVAGPLNATRPPQGYPVIFQAGASDAGLAFAGRSAEVVFATQSFKDQAVAFAGKLALACEAGGRPRDAAKLLLGVCPIVADSEEDAKEIIARLGSMLDPVAALRVLSDRIGHDLSTLPLDEPLPDLPETGMTQGHSKMLTAIAQRHKMTLRQLRDFAAISSGHRVVMGTAKQIADDLEDWFRAGACDGFAIMAPWMPAPFARFVDEVVPLLVQRGLFRAEYTGTTLRDHLGLDRPAHPAAG